jgi:uncharacterized protein with PIN domain
MTAVRFMLDEHLPKDVAAALRRMGIQSYTVHELGRRTASDESHLEFGVLEGWVLVTFDRRLLGIASAMGTHSGVVVGMDQAFSIGGLVRGLQAIAKAESMESMRDYVAYL